MALYRTANALDLQGELRAIYQPTLVLHGTADQIVPVEAAEQLVQALPNARLVLLHGAGHVPTMTRPDEVAREIAQFLLAMGEPTRMTQPTQRRG